MLPLNSPPPSSPITISTTMEGISLKAYRGIRRCWRRRGYQRLKGPPARDHEEARSGSDQSGGRRRVWRWRIRVGRRIRLGSPRKWLARLRDAYVKMMLSFAGAAPLGVGYAAEYGGFGRPAAKEYDEKRLVEMYKSVLRAQAQGQMVVRAAPNPHTVACYVA